MAYDNRFGIVGLTGVPKNEGSYHSRWMVRTDNVNALDGVLGALRFKGLRQEKKQAYSRTHFRHAADTSSIMPRTTCANLHGRRPDLSIKLNQLDA